MTDVLLRKARNNRLHVGRIKIQLQNIIAKGLAISNISEYEVLLNEFKAEKKAHSDVVEEILMMMDDNDKDFATDSNKLLVECDSIRSTLALYEGKAKAFHRSLETQAHQDSLLHQDPFNSTFRSSNANSITPKFETIKVPKFDGDILTFPSFKGLYENIVHNNTDLTNVQKLYYLKKALVGDVKDLVRDFDLTDSAYTEAWSFVLDQFDSKKVVVKALFNKLIEIEPIRNENKIRNLINQFSVIVRGLKAAGLNIDDSFSKFVAFLVVSRLDSRTARDFENTITGKDTVPTFEEVQKFLQSRSFGINEPIVAEVPKKPNAEKKPKTTKASRSSFMVSSNDSASKKCPKCLANHVLSECQQFSSLTQPERFEFAKNNRYCIRCLNPGHTVSKCKSNLKCATCNGAHHTILHRDAASAQTSPKIDVDNSSSDLNSPSTSRGSYMSTASKAVMLQTAVVRVKINSISGPRFVLARVFLDNGSQTTLVSEKFVKDNRIKIVRSADPTMLGGIIGDSVRVDYSINMTLCSRFNDFKLDIEAGLISKIPYSVTWHNVKELSDKYAHLCFAEHPMPSNEVDILLGAEFYEKCLRNNSLNTNTVVLRDTHFGWVASGMIQLPQINVTNLCGLTTVSVQDQLGKFWALEEVDVPKSDIVKLEHNRCNEIVSQSLIRDESGRFVTRLPLKIDRSCLGESRPKAIAALNRVENKYDAVVREEYGRVIQEYLDLNHLEKIDSQVIPKHSYYIPHRPVFKPTSTSTKLRIVFNASMPTSTGLSLNSILYEGPTIQPDIVDNEICFRAHNIAFACDIVKMYRQIRIATEDCDLQRIVWMSHSSDEYAHKIQDGRLTVLAFGLGPSSFIATKCLEVLSDSIIEQHPEAGRAIKENFVVDNLITGAKTLKEALELQNVIHTTLESAHFPLRKYMSNSSEFLKSIPESFHEEMQVLSFSSKDAVSLLGLCWVPKDDTLAIQLKLKEDRSCFQALTKRLLLSEIARVYDPLGIVAPITIRAKLMLQQVWSENISWDDVVSTNLISDFINYYNDLESLQGFAVRRRYSKFDNPKELQLIGFADASDRAYAAVVYLRSIDSEGNIDSNFVIAKTKVAPRNQFKLTVPKLELQAAELLARLMKRVSNDLKIDSLHAFSDSTAVLGWLKGDINRWTVFVQNRIRKITNVIPCEKWSYVRSSQNSADFATRGISVQKLRDESAWLGGPSFIVNNVDLSVVEIDKSINILDLPEIRKAKELCNLAIVQSDVSLLDRYSSFDKLVNIVSYCMHFIHNCKRRDAMKSCNDHIINLEDRNLAINCLIKMSQLYFFSVEIGALINDKPLRRSSCIRMLVPFIDKTGILRTNTRLNNSHFSYDMKNPVILHSKCKLVYLLVKHVHVTYYHATKSFIKRFILSKYHVVGNLTNIVKRVIKSCIVCIRYSKTTVMPMMGQLPVDRVTIARPFSKVGVDFCGPFKCRCVNHRNVKFYNVYAAIFVCFVTRAVHIETVCDLTSLALIEAMQRFMARRGIPSDIYSDNGTNFVGVDNWFKVESPELKKFVLFKGFQWHFMPPRAPHHGGLWEAGVKSVKHHLVRITNGQALNYEEYITVFANIECILNSRPLCYSKSGDVGSILTPAHFLIGESLINLPIPDSSTTKLPLMRRYELLRIQIKSFWKYWSVDYLNSLKNRSKWTKPVSDLKVGDLVVLQVDQHHPSEWPIGLIVSVSPGNDGVVRVVDIKIGNRVYRRPVSKVALIPCDDVQ